jgi:hypothetical protein
MPPTASHASSMDRRRLAVASLVRGSASNAERRGELSSHQARAAAPHSWLPGRGDTQYSPLEQLPSATVADATATASDLMSCPLRFRERSIR